MSIEAMKQLREVHEVQGRDGCWDIDDYMLGMFNGLELALSLMEGRATKYKTRKEFEQAHKQEPVAWRYQSAVGGWAYGKEPPIGSKYAVEPLYTSPPQRQPEQEPVGRFSKFTDGVWKEVTATSAGQPLYALPPQRRWVGLTQDDVIRLATQARLPYDYETQNLVWLDKLETFAKLVAEKVLLSLKDD